MDAIRSLGSRKTTIRIVRKIKVIADSRQSGLDYHIRWVPGHERIQGTEETHRIAREQLCLNHQQDCAQSVDIDVEAQTDAEEGIELAEAERKGVLLNKVANDPDLLPPNSAAVRQ